MEAVPGLWMGLGPPSPATMAVPVSGFLQVDYTSPERVWTQHPDAPYSDLGTVYAGSAHHVPSFRPDGLVVILGGNELEPETRQSQNRNMDMLWFMDPTAPDQWHSQKTTNAPPARRRWPCVVGAQGRNNTYEIFIFGGNTDDGQTFGDIWILSLPGFFWTVAQHDSNIKRTLMSCVVAGQRQMIVVGGLNNSDNNVVGKCKGLAPRLVQRRGAVD
ncbi:kelch repeat protein [Colletotrichum chrysophilum]|uniref:Kelch repeat protein n=1 Tax=Colletotrichum chrysophilum TaxID=1836956 RepID=A0AAD9E7T2_9PEZI|nr:kelch repeat protein [Colletotrichum chrysophilum]